MAVSARISKSGQVTIPVEIRKKLGIKPGDSVIWRVDEHGRAEITPVRYTFDELRGIAGPSKDGKDLLATIDDAMAEWGASKRRESEAPDS